MKNLQDLSIFDFKKGELPKDNKNGAVLTTLEGYATFNDDDTNRNRRYYPTKDGKSFWSRILDGNERVKEMMETKTFFGAAKHPGKNDSPMPEFENTSHAIRDYKIDDKGVWVTIDVLNTESGRVVKTLADYGSKIGISTRAYGEQVEDKKGRLIPVEDNYQFITWDLVFFPAYNKARLDQVNDDFMLDIKESDINVSKEKMMDDIKKMNPESAQMICDYVGLDASQFVKKPKINDEEVQQITSLRKELESATDRIIALEKENKEGNMLDSLLISFKDKSKGKSKKELELLKAIEDSIVPEYENKMKALSDEISTIKEDSSKKINELTAQNDSLVVELKMTKSMQDQVEGLLLDADKDLKIVRTEKAQLKELFESKTIEYNKVVKLNDELERHTKALTDQLLETEKQLSEKVVRVKRVITKANDSVQRPMYAALDTTRSNNVEIEEMNEEDGLGRTIQKTKKTKF